MQDYSVFFFFKAEDGIRDDLVTGVQTCALPICLAGKEPTLRRGIGRAAQKCGYHQIMGGLRSWKISLDPNPVAGREIGNFRRRQCLGASGDLDVKGRTGKVERRGSGLRRRSENYC